MNTSGTMFAIGTWVARRAVDFKFLKIKAIARLTGKGKDWELQQLMRGIDMDTWTKNARAAEFGHSMERALGIPQNQSGFTGALGAVLRGEGDVCEEELTQITQLFRDDITNDTALQVFLKLSGAREDRLAFIPGYEKDVVDYWRSLKFIEWHQFIYTLDQQVNALTEMNARRLRKINHTPVVQK